MAKHIDELVTMEDLAILEFGPLLHKEPDWRQMTSGFLPNYKLIWQILTKDKDALVKLVAEMDETTLDQVHRLLDNAVYKAKSDKSMAKTARVRIMSACAVIALGKEGAGHDSN